MAELNECNNVKLHSKVDSQSISELIQGETFIVCDCEGFEEVNLDPTKQPRLLECDLLVEVHDHLAPGVSEKLNKWYVNTHHVEWINPERRSIDEYQSLFPELTREQLREVLDEERDNSVCWVSLRRLSRLPNQ